MTEHLSANDDPVSQAALHLLNKAGLGTPSEHLYLLDLMLWGIESGKAEIDRGLAWELESAIGADLLPKKPEKVLAWLMYPEGSREPPRLDPEWLRTMEPGDASRELLEPSERPADGNDRLDTGKAAPGVERLSLKEIAVAAYAAPRRIRRKIVRVGAGWMTI